MKTGLLSVLPRLNFTQHKMLTDPRVVKELAQKFRIINKFDVPYIAGYSKNGRDIYFDRHFIPKFNGKDITPFIALHEKIEKTLISVFKLKYPSAHMIAQYCEKQAVEMAGMKWNAYQSYCVRYIKKIGSEDLNIAPPDLDLTPYKDEHDNKALSHMYRKND
jgi:hypothetical protein